MEGGYSNGDRSLDKCLVISNGAEEGGSSKGAFGGTGVEERVDDDVVSELVVMMGASNGDGTATGVEIWEGGTLERVGGKGGKGGDDIENREVGSFSGPSIPQSESTSDADDSSKLRPSLELVISISFVFFRWDGE